MLVKRVIHRLMRMVRRMQTPQLISIPQNGLALGGVDVLGFFTSEHGVGEAARVLAATLKSGAVPISIIDYTDTQSRRGHAYNCDNVSQYKVLLASINSDQLSAAHTSEQLYSKMSGILKYRDSTQPEKLNSDKRW